MWRIPSSVPPDRHRPPDDEARFLGLDDLFTVVQPDELGHPEVIGRANIEDLVLAAHDILRAGAVGRIEGPDCIAESSADVLAVHGALARRRHHLPIKAAQAARQGVAHGVIGPEVGRLARVVTHVRGVGHAEAVGRVIDPHAGVAGSPVATQLDLTKRALQPDGRLAVPETQAVGRAQGLACIRQDGGFQVEAGCQPAAQVFLALEAQAVGEVVLVADAFDSA